MGVLLTVGGRRRRGVGEAFGLGVKIGDAPPQGVPLTGLGVLRRSYPRVLNGRYPMGQLFASTGKASAFKVANLRQFREAIRLAEESDRRDLHTHDRPVFVYVQGRCGVGLIPEVVPLGISLRAVVRAAFLVVALGGCVA